MYIVLCYGLGTEPHVPQVVRSRPRRRVRLSIERCFGAAAQGFTYMLPIAFLCRHRAHV